MSVFAFELSLGINKKTLAPGNDRIDFVKLVRYIVRRKASRVSLINVGKTGAAR